MEKDNFVTIQQLQEYSDYLKKEVEYLKHLPREEKRRLRKKKLKRILK
jgi:hypothetical protein